MISKTHLATQMLKRSGLGTLLRKTSRRSGFVVLNYHRIGNTATNLMDPGVFSATAEQFERHLRFLKRDFDVIVPQDIEGLPARGRGNYTMITFDDGYRDNYELAYPVLKAQKLRAVFFLATGFLDRPRVSWWDEIAWMARKSPLKQIEAGGLIPRVVLTGVQREEAITQLIAAYRHAEPGQEQRMFLEELSAAAEVERFPKNRASSLWLTWDMVAEMRAGGMVIGGHSVHHPILSTLSRFDQELEISGCAAAIEQHLGEPMEYFSYPRGKPDAFNEETREVLLQNGVKYAFSYYGGMNRFSTFDPLDVRRVPIDSETNLEHFEAMVSLPEVFA
jgi:peptidoglycan/xylan/chitin deacetylase (PgdA/CDA1 family)